MQKLRTKIAVAILGMVCFFSFLAAFFIFNYELPKELNKSEIILTETDTSQLELFDILKNGKKVECDKNDVVWVSSNEKVATVDENGLVTAVAKGDVEIQAICKKETFICNVKVNALTFSVTNSLNLIVDKSETIEVDKNIEDKVIFKSKDEKIAKVDKDGKVTAVEVGKTVIIAELRGKTKECRITVSNEFTTSPSKNVEGESLGNSSGVSSENYPKVHSDGSSTITVTKEWYNNAWCYIAHLQFSDYSRFGTSCANGVYGGAELIQNAHSRLGSILTVNGCYSAPYLDYAVARDGVVHNDKACWSPAVYNKNNGLLLSAWETGGTSGIAGVQLSSLVSSGSVTDTFCFGPPILNNGGITVGADGGRAQRTFIGTNGNAGDIWIVVSDGRYVDGVSAGLTAYECASLLQSKGCTFGVPLDGGGSSTMVFKGEVLNCTSGRAIVDFVYFR